MNPVGGVVRKRSMAIHTLRTHQIIPAAIGDCWEFFSDPGNLARITPPGLDFQIVSELPEKIYPGLMIEYRVRPLLGLQMTWLTEITHVNRPFGFVDEQRVGPYQIWHHEHRFQEMDDGQTEMCDLVHYVLPFSPFSEVVHPWLVVPELKRIFDFREQAVRKFFPERQSGAAAAVGRVLR
jgi:ligand-binding SRPBCC domain-containing protein